MSNIHHKLRSGVFYTALAKYSNVVSSIILSAILARILTPTEFGTVAILMVFITFFNLLGNFGIGPAIIQNKNLSKIDIESIFTFSIVLALLLASLFFISSIFISEFYERPELLNLSRLMSLIIFFSTMRVVPGALNRKKLKFKQIGIVEVFAQLIGGITAIILAYLGFSYYAIVINGILSSFITFIAFYKLAPIKFSFRFNFSSVNKILKFSSYQFFFNVINYFSRNADNLLIGKFFNTEMLGFYDKAYRLMLMPVQNLTHVITPVLHPVLSKHHNQKEVLYNSYQKIVKLLVLIGLPFSVFLFFASNEIVYLMYGSQWSESVPVFRILALTVGIQIVLSSTGSIFQAANRADLMFISGLIGALFMLTGIGYGVFVGKSLIHVGYGILIAFIFNFFQGMYLLISKTLNSSLFKFLKVFIIPLFTSLLIAFVLFIFIQIQIYSIVISLICKFLLSSSVFLLVTYSIKEERKFLKIYWAQIFKKK